MLHLYNMPEGPSLVILREAVEQFTGKEIIAVEGNTKLDKDRLLNKKVVAFKTWGKHFLISFDELTVRIHFLLFGSYLINDTKKTAVRLGCTFPNGFLNFYACAVKFIEEDIDTVYDWSADVMSDDWDPKKAKAKLLAQPNELACDVLLDQDIFSGVGNIIKNEVLYRIKVHPASKVGDLPAAKLNALIKEARIYSFQFKEWKLKYELKKHWLAHTKTVCSRDGNKITRQVMGKTRRRTFFCEKCQVLYG